MNNNMQFVPSYFDKIINIDLILQGVLTFLLFKCIYINNYNII